MNYSTVRSILRDTGNSETKTQINVNWTNDEVAAIIGIWANVEIQGQLDGMRRNKKVYELISEEMSAHGFDFCKNFYAETRLNG